MKIHSNRQDHSSHIISPSISEASQEPKCRAGSQVRTAWMEIQGFRSGVLGCKLGCNLISLNLFSHLLSGASFQLKWDLMRCKSESIQQCARLMANAHGFCSFTITCKGAAGTHTKYLHILYSFYSFLYLFPIFQIYGQEKLCPKENTRKPLLV